MAERADGTDEALELDLEVALVVCGYRWVEWNRRSMADAPHYEPGRFVAHPDDLQSHLQVAAAPDAPLSSVAYHRLPRYSGDERLALAAAEEAGLFSDGGAELSKSDGGAWLVELEGAGISLEDESLPRLLCRATLQWARAGRSAEAP